jgi:tripartite-type tricarboxylate transporter receptor subunit TctC
MKRLITAAIVAVLAGNAPASAQTFPSRPITIIVPFAAGGPTDALARILGDRMRQSLGRRRHDRRRSRGARSAGWLHVEHRPPGNSCGQWRDLSIEF